ncbi:unnamed protein product, partial [Mesorhabditis spiculigera]
MSTEDTVSLIEDVLPRTDETPEGIQARRDEILSNYDQFKELAAQKKEKLGEAKELQLFKVNADELEEWLLDAIARMENSDSTSLTNTQVKLRRHKTCVAEMEVTGKRLTMLRENAVAMIRYGHFGKEFIEKRLDELMAMWAKLQGLASERTVLLEKALTSLEFTQRCDRLLAWLEEKDALLKNDFEAPKEGDVAGLQPRFESLFKDIQSKVNNVNEIALEASSLLEKGVMDEVDVMAKRDLVTEKWHEVLARANECNDALFGKEKTARVIETMTEMRLNITDYYKKLKAVGPAASSDGLEQQICALDLLMNEISAMRTRLAPLKPEAVSVGKQKEVEKLFKEVQKLEEALVKKREALAAEKKRITFFGDYTDIVAKADDILAALNDTEMPADVDNVKEAQEQLQDLEGEIAAQIDVIANTIRQAEELKTSKDVDEKVQDLSKLRDKLSGAAEKRKEFLGQSLQLREWQWETEQLRASLSRMTDMIKRLTPVEPAAAETAKKQFDDLHRKVSPLRDVYNMLIARSKDLQGVGEDAGDVMAKELEQVESTLEALEQLCASLKKEIQDATELAEFETDLRPIRHWIDENARKRSEVKVSLHKKNIRLEERGHDNFLNELKAHKEQLNAMRPKAEQLSKNGAETAIRDFEEVADRWNELNSEASARTEFFEKAAAIILLDRKVEELAGWLDRHESTISGFFDGTSGRDLDIPTIKAKLKSLAGLQKSFEDQRKTIEELENQLLETGDEKSMARLAKCKGNFDEMAGRLEAVQSKLDACKKDLDLLAKVQEELIWTREKLKISITMDSDEVMKLRNAYKQVKMLTAEINDHAAVVETLVDQVEEMQKKATSFPQLNTATSTLADLFDELATNTEIRLHHLGNLIAKHEYWDDVDQAQNWIKEMTGLLFDRHDYNDDEGAERAFRQHEAFCSDLLAYNNTIFELRTAAENLAETCPTATPRVMCVEKFLARNERELSIQKGDDAQLLDDSNGDWWKIHLHGLIGFVPGKFVRKIEIHDDKAILPLQEHIEKEYQKILQKAETKRRQIESVRKGYHLNRDVIELTNWVTEKYNQLRSRSEATDPDDDPMIDLNEQWPIKEAELRALYTRAHEFSAEEVSRSTFSKNLDQLSEQWKQLVDAVAGRKQGQAARLAFAAWVHEAAEFEGRIGDKEFLLSDEPEGANDNRINKIARDFETAQGDMNQLEQLVDQIVRKGESLRREFPEISQTTYEKQRAICDRWNTLVTKMEQRKTELARILPLQHFRAANQDVLKWIDAETPIISSTGLADDVEGIQALIDQHAESWNEIKTHEAIFAKSLQNSSIAGTPEMKDIVHQTVDAFKQMHERWQQRQDLLEEALNCKKFLRDCKQFDAWLTTNESAVRLDVSGENFAVLLTRQDELQQAIEKKTPDYARLEERAQLIIAHELPDKEEAEKRFEAISSRWEQLKADLIDARNRIGDERTVQDFTRQADAAESWMREKVMIMEEYEYLSTEEKTQRMQRHDALGEELKMMQDRITKVIAAGQDALNSSRRSMDQTDFVTERVHNVEKQWRRLEHQYGDLSKKMEKENRRQAFEKLASEVEAWLGKVENAAASRDFGNDIGELERLQRENELLNAELNVYADKVIDLSELLEEMPKECPDESIDLDQVVADASRARASAIVENFDKVRKQAENRAELLEKALDAHLIAKKIDDLVSWVSETRILAQSADYGRDSRDFQNLVRKHRRLMDEMVSHQQQLKHIWEQCEGVKPEIRTAVRLDAKMEDLDAAMQTFEVALQQRELALVDYENYYKLATQIDEGVYWLVECAELLAHNVEARSSAAVESALKKHIEFEAEIEAHSEHYKQLIEAVDTSSDGVCLPQLREKISRLQQCYDKVNDLCLRRRAELEEAEHLVHFQWRCDVIEGWIAEQSKLVHPDEQVDSLESAKRLGLRHSLFVAKLKSFEKDQIQKFEKMLPQGDNSEGPRRHWEMIMKKWKALKHEADMVSMHMDEMEGIFSHLEDLWLEFARRASAFNSWFESVEEDLTEPLPFCNSMDALNVLKVKHGDLIESLEVYEKEYQALVQLDADARKTMSAVNPFTWFDVQSIELCWNQVLSFIATRTSELDAEHERQVTNDKQRMEFAKAANEVADWMAGIREKAFKLEGTLEEQMDKLRQIVIDIVESRPVLARVDSMGAALERKMLITNPYTNHSRMGLAHAWENLEQLVSRLRQSVDEQIRAKKEGSISEETLKEYANVFLMFDKDMTGYVSGDDALKCLSVLGMDVGEVDGNRLTQGQRQLVQQLDPYNEGRVSFQNFLNWTIAQETPNVHKGDDVLAAFRALTRDGRAYVTRDEILSVLSPEEADYCLKLMPKYVDPKTGQTMSQAYDYRRFVETIIS